MRVLSMKRRSVVAVSSSVLLCGLALAQPEPMPPVETPVPMPETMTDPEPTAPAEAIPPVDTPSEVVTPPPPPAEVIVPAPPSSAAPVATGVILGGLDKVAARTAKLEVGLKQPVFYNTLIVTAHACKTRPPEEPPESAAFLEIQDRKPDGTIQKIFSGWMFASSPALNALEHAVYDVWVVSCKTAPAKPASPAPDNS
jgi:hypothetical protein